MQKRLLTKLAAVVAVSCVLIPASLLEARFIQENLEISVLWANIIAKCKILKIEEKEDFKIFSVSIEKVFKGQKSVGEIVQFIVLYEWECGGGCIEEKQPILLLQKRKPDEKKVEETIASLKKKRSACITDEEREASIRYMPALLEARKKGIYEIRASIAFDETVGLYFVDIPVFDDDDSVIVKEVKKTHSWECDGRTNAYTETLMYTSEDKFAEYVEKWVKPEAWQ